MSKYLEDQGHDVRVLCPIINDVPPVLSPEISKDKIHYTKFFDVNIIPDRVKSWLKSFFGKDISNKSKADVAAGKSEIVNQSRKESKISILYRQIINIPDNKIGWYYYAIHEGKKIFQEWTPDIVFATLPLFTGMLVAHRLSRLVDVPVIYDYRDLWTGHPYYSKTGIRKFIDCTLENHMRKHCAGLVTVTKTWAEQLKSYSDVPVEFVMNGFDPSDFNLDIQETYDKDKITLLYSGFLYGDKRDPSVLFEALGQMGEKAKNYNVLFYIPDGAASLTDQHRSLIDKYNLEDVVQCRDYIPQKNLLRIQQTVDVLLLLRWDHPSENGVIAGKLFEYIGAGKEILSLGSISGEAVDIIRDNDFGIVSNDPKEISKYLDDMFKKKRSQEIAPIINPNREKFTRAKQFKKLEAFMGKIIQNK